MKAHPCRSRWKQQVKQPCDENADGLMKGVPLGNVEMIGSGESASCQGGATVCRQSSNTADCESRRRKMLTVARGWTTKMPSYRYTPVAKTTGGKAQLPFAVAWKDRQRMPEISPTRTASCLSQRAEKRALTSTLFFPSAPHDELGNLSCVQARYLSARVDGTGRACAGTSNIPTAGP
jgi:hypothetical protein